MPVKRVFLIKPAYKDSYYKYNDLPAGLGYISQALDNNNVDNIVFDMHADKNTDNLLETIGKFSPELIGLSLMSYRFLRHYELITLIKSNCPNIPIVVGGPHVSTFREDVLRKCESIDYGITLEGDETIVELCYNIKSPSLVKGLIYRENSDICYTTKSLRDAMILHGSCG